MSKYALTQEQKDLIDEIVDDPYYGKNGFIECHERNPYLWDDDRLHDIPLETIYEYLGEEMTTEKRLKIAYENFSVHVTNSYQGREKDFQAGMKAACEILGVSIGEV
ncbi:hypothetical protein D1872_88460 [compost metagenome]